MTSLEGFSNLDPRLVAAVRRLLADVRAEGRTVRITDGFRTFAQQAAAAAAKPGLALPAGRSKHERGLAVDLDADVATLRRVADLAPRYGLRVPRPVDDPYHVEVANA